MKRFSLKRANNGVWFGTFAHFDHLNLKHGVSSRLGGLSKPPFATLNMGMKGSDDPATVKLNRKLFCQAVGVPVAATVTAQQVHSDKICVVEKQDAGRGADSYETAIPGTDALITAVPDIPLMLFFADCVPVLIFDPVKRVVAISHAGWKGTVAKIAQKTVLMMQEKFATRPADCIAAIGPSIGPDSYEVDQPVIDALQASFPEWEELVVPRGDRWLLDLWLTNRRQLEEIGVDGRNIEVSGVCTQCNPELFYSHRAEKGNTGRMGAIIML
ncbi:MAG: peptidoglycan editing factor PgeF [Negativicutes bacterium]|nr:peptidoglycan editing factor PgeF [Negativicutes bacterium]